MPEESLQLAIYDLAARQLWPNASRVELEIELLRHGTVIRTTRTDEQRAATREYVLATIAQIEAAESGGGEFPTRPTLQCPTCDHREQCAAYADALAAKRTFVCTDPEDLAAVSREREEVARLVKTLRQAAGGARAEGRWAVAVCKDNRRLPLVTMSFEDFVALLRDWHELRMQRR